MIRGAEPGTELINRVHLGDPMAKCVVMEKRKRAGRIYYLVQITDPGGTQFGAGDIFEGRPHWFDRLDRHIHEL